MKCEEFAKKARKIADELNTLRLEVFQEPTSEDKEDKEDKEYVDRRLFELQSQIRNIAFLIENSYFVNDWKK